MRPTGGLFRSSTHRLDMAALVSQQVNELLVIGNNGSHAALNQSGRWSTD